jgi:hypothetical protein
MSMVDANALSSAVRAISSSIRAIRLNRAVVFEAELAFEGVVDRFGDLALRSEEPLARRSCAPVRVARSRSMPGRTTAGVCTHIAQVFGEFAVACVRDLEAL